MEPITEPEAVVEGHGGADAVLLGGAEGERDRHAVVEQVVVGEEDAFGGAGGAGGVLDVGDVVGCGGVAREIAAAGEHGVPGRLAEPDDVFQGKGVAVARIVEDGAIVGAGVALAEEEGADAGLLEDVAELVRAVGGVDVDQDDAGAGGGVLHEDPLDAVAGPDAGAVAGRESEAGESAGDAGGFAIEFTPGEADVLMADDEGFAVRETGGGVREGLRDGLFQEGRCGPAGIAERWQCTSVTP